MLFTQQTRSSHPMTKDVMAKVMDNPNYFLDMINEMKISPKRKPILDIILEKYPQKQP